MTYLQTTARRQLDRRLAALRDELTTAPPQGWIVAVRTALGMSVRELGQRMGVSGQRASKLERDEIGGGIRLDSLQRAAEAMNCRLVYAFVPNEPLEAMVRGQARRKAAGILAPIAHSMRIEEQSVPYEVEREQIEELASELIDRRGLWSEPAP